jgi:hypothetical protein
MSDTRRRFEVRYQYILVYSEMMIYRVISNKSDSKKHYPRQPRKALAVRIKYEKGREEN